MTSYTGAQYKTQTWLDDDCGVKLTNEGSHGFNSRPFPSGNDSGQVVRKSGALLQSICTGNKGQ